MVDWTPPLIFAVIALSVPLQFYLSPRTSSDVKFYLVQLIDELKEFFHKYIAPAAEDVLYDRDAGEDVSQVIDEIVDENVLKESRDKLTDAFGGSEDPRDPRAPHIKFRVGQVIRHRLHNYRGVIVGWDEKARAPDWWIERVYKDRTDLLEYPTYTILIDTRDRLHPQMGYVVEENIVLASGAIVHPLTKHYFESFDGTCYKSRPWHKKVYPND